MTAINKWVKWLDISSFWHQKEGKLGLLAFIVVVYGKRCTLLIGSNCTLHSKRAHPSIFYCSLLEPKAKMEDVYTLVNYTLSFMKHQGRLWAFWPLFLTWIWRILLTFDLWYVGFSIDIGISYDSPFHLNTFGSLLLMLYVVQLILVQKSCTK